LWPGDFTPAVAGNCDAVMNLENLIVGGIAVVLFLYLMVAMLRPEKF